MRVGGAAQSWAVLLVLACVAKQSALCEGLGIVPAVAPCDLLVGRGEQQFLFPLSAAASPTTLVSVDRDGHTYA